MSVIESIKQHMAKRLEIEAALAAAPVQPCSGSQTAIQKGGHRAPHSPSA